MSRLDVQLPSLEAAMQAAAGADIVALTASLHFDHETAVALADRFVDEPYMFLLESASAGPNARYSFLGFDPLWVWRWSYADGRLAHLSRRNAHGELETHRVPWAAEHPIAALRERMLGHKLVSVHAESVRLGGPDVALMAGPAGFFGYDTALALEPSIGQALPKKLGLPDAVWFLPRNFLVLDHLQRRLFVTRLVPTSAKVAPEAVVDRRYIELELDHLRGLLRKLSGSHTPPPLLTKDLAPDFAACEASLSKEEFFDIAGRCLDEIRAGEIFQIQIGNRLRLATKARPFDVFRHLRIINPSPYMFFYKFAGDHVLGASPEMMVGVQQGRVTHRPIAGTRRRTWDQHKDLRLKHELINSEKERAEHVMLVDLGRNDVGRVARPGSVKVEELMVVEEYSHVFHMVSQVAGDLADGIDAFQALAAAFPNGTVAGAPKIRAMQLINSMEKISREFYAGSLGLFDFFGNLRSTILIRSLHMAHGYASTQASAGIVFDSLPEQEWLETKNKMTAALLAMQNTL